MREFARNLFVMLVFAAALVAFLFGAASSVVHASEARNTDMERFLPNNGNSVFNASCLLREWPPEGPKQLWRVEIGWGKTAVVEAGDQAYTATQTGKLQWTTHVKSDSKRELGAPSSLTCQLVDGIPQVIVATYGTREILGVHAGPEVR